MSGIENVVPNREASEPNISKSKKSKGKKKFSKKSQKNQRQEQGTSESQHNTQGDTQLHKKKTQKQPKQQEKQSESMKDESHPEKRSKETQSFKQESEESEGSQGSEGSDHSGEHEQNLQAQKELQNEGLKSKNQKLQQLEQGTRTESQKDQGEKTNQRKQSKQDQTEKSDQDQTKLHEGLGGKFVREKEQIVQGEGLRQDNNVFQGKQSEPEEKRDDETHGKSSSPQGETQVKSNEKEPKTQKQEKEPKEQETRIQLHPHTELQLYPIQTNRFKGSQEQPQHLQEPPSQHAINITNESLEQRKHEGMEQKEKIERLLPHPELKLYSVQPARFEEPKEHLDKSEQATSVPSKKKFEVGVFDEGSKIQEENVAVLNKKTNFPDDVTESVKDAISKKGKEAKEYLQDKWENIKQDKDAQPYAHQMEKKAEGAKEKFDETKEAAKSRSSEIFEVVGENYQMYKQKLLDTVLDAGVVIKSSINEYASSIKHILSGPNALEVVANQQAFIDALANESSFVINVPKQAEHYEIRFVPKGSKLCWQFIVESMDIEFCLKQRVVEKETNQLVHYTILERQIYQAGQKVQGKWEADEDSTALLVWNNSYSTFTAKNIACRIAVVN